MAWSWTGPSFSRDTASASVTSGGRPRERRQGGGAPVEAPRDEALVCLHEWAATRSGLGKPSRDLEDEEGKGIFRRFFYWIPAKGAGAVDRSRLPTYKADGTSKRHEFVDIVPGTVSTLHAACHMCDVLGGRPGVL